MTATTRTTECTAVRRRCIWRLSWAVRSGRWGSRRRRRSGRGFARSRRAIWRPGAGDAAARRRALGCALDAPVRSCYEAGRDGFWLHRWLVAHGVTNIVVDSSSIEVNRRARRAKTDRLDVRKLLALLLRWAAGNAKSGAWCTCHRRRPKTTAS